MKNQTDTGIGKKGKPGFKLTKLGWIPEEWEVKEVRSCGVIVTGNTPSRKRLEFWGGNCYWATAQDFNGKYLNITSETLSAEGEKVAKTVPKGSVLVTCIASIGLNAIANCVLSFNQQINAIIPNKEEDGEFLYYVMEFIKPKLKKLAGVTAVPIINKSSFEKMLISCPSLYEQQKIARILSTWDKAIEKTEQLIQAKTQLKKGLMQQLLTGKRRFKEFEGEKWREVKLDNVAIINMGQSPNSAEYNLTGEGLPLIQGNADIKNRISSPNIWTRHITKTCNAGDILLTVRAPVGSVARSNQKACIGRGIASITATKISSDYLFYLLLSHETNWLRLEQGSTFTAVNRSDLKKMKIVIPTSQNEQLEIATVLNGIDNEVTKNVILLDNLKRQKKGLM